MKKLFLFTFGFYFLLFSFYFSSAIAESAADAYKTAHECYVNLKADEKAQKVRENWERCINEFKSVAKNHRRSEKGGEAQYSLGRVYEGLAENSKNQADWKLAVSEYQKYAMEHPRGKMADDAYFRAARIEWERLHDKELAKKDLLKVIKHYKNSDMAREAQKYLNEMEKSGADGSIAYNLTIVIDPGHGGSDTGAVGPDGKNEKELTLIISKKLAEDIRVKMKNAKVYLTRDHDATLTLDDRVRFANKKKADLFISIHANASTSKKERGIQTYYLNNATDKAAERLAMQENKNSGKKASDLDKILATMIQNASTDESRELAKSIHKNLIKGLSSKYSDIEDQKVRSALFYVLVGVKCPSVLIETSYISNPKEEKRLENAKYQALIASSITDGVSNHIKFRKNLAIN